VCCELFIFRSNQTSHWEFCKVLWQWLIHYANLLLKSVLYELQCVCSAGLSRYGAQLCFLWYHNVWVPHECGARLCQSGPFSQSLALVFFITYVTGVDLAYILSAGWDLHLKLSGDSWDVSWGLWHTGPELVTTSLLRPSWHDSRSPKDK
jgi:hypothetical protein